MLEAHGFHGARGTAYVARVAGLAKHDSDVVEDILITHKLPLTPALSRQRAREFIEVPKNAKIAF
jgi:hypothetical protein